jgi:hypothetical protein
MDSAAPCENNDYWTFSHIKTVPAGSVRMVNVRPSIEAFIIMPPNYWVSRRRRRQLLVGLSRRRLVQ